MMHLIKANQDTQLLQDACVMEAQHIARSWVGSIFTVAKHFWFFYTQKQHIDCSEKKWDWFQIIVLMTQITNYIFCPIIMKLF